MEKDGFFVQMKELLQEYVEDRLLLVRLQLTEKAAKVSSAVFISVAVGFVGLVLFMIISFIAGYYLSVLVNSYPGGFAILGGIYLLLIILLLVLHKKYTAKIVADSVVKFSLSSPETFNNEI